MSIYGNCSTGPKCKSVTYGESQYLMSEQSEGDTISHHAGLNKVKLDAWRAKNRLCARITQPGFSVSEAMPRNNWRHGSYTK